MVSYKVFGVRDISGAVKMVAWQRARQPGQKAERRASILQAAAELLAEGEYQAVSLNRIAQRVGIAKSNIYRYFETKEEVFLHLYLEDIAFAVEGIIVALAGQETRWRPEKVAQLLAHSISRHPRRATLLALCSGVLERNLSVETLVGYKRTIIGEAERLVSALCDALPGLEPEQAWRFLHYEHALIAGLWPLANLSPGQSEVQGREEFKQLRIDFENDLERALALLLQGMLASGIDTSEDRL